MKKIITALTCFAFSSFMMAQVLVSNGPFVTHPGGGPGGMDASALDTATHSTYGFGHQLANFNRVADDFTIPANVYWFVDSVIFYQYQTGSTTTSTINHVDFMVWNGQPESSTIMYGDSMTNRFDGSTFSGCYRTRNIDLTTANTRPIMRTVHKFTPTLMLGPGTYFLDWRCGGSLGSGPWANPIAIVSQVNMGDAQQRIAGVWNALVDAKLSSTVGLPFVLKGTVSAAGINELGTTVNMNLWPNPVTDVANVGINLMNGQVLSDYTFSVIDVLGKEVVRMDNLTSGNFQINCLELPAGVYVYKLSSANGVANSGKFNVVK